MPHPFAFDTPPRIDEPELIEDDTQPYPDLRASMRDVRRANRFLGGTAVVTRQAARWLRAVPDPQARLGTVPVTILDVATGSGDIPEAILTTARRAGIAVQIIGLDVSAPILRCAREQVGAPSTLRLVRSDAFRLPFADACIDYVICSLAFHHFGMENARMALREMERVARRGWLVNDLRRTWSAWWLIRAVTAVSGVNRLTRHDAPASVLRAYSLDEYREMVRSLGLRVGREVQLRRSLFYRVALIREKE